jgi:Ca-activated chloride channel family protein
MALAMPAAPVRSSRKFPQMPIHRSLGFTFRLLLLAVGLAAHIQAQGRVFKSTVEMVSLTVTVTDAKGHYVRDLVETDFSVLEEGVRQSLALFANEAVPIDLALTIDASASMTPQLPVVRKAAGALVDSLRGRDRATVVTIKNAVDVTLPLTSDRSRISTAIRDLSASGRTALYDGVYVVLSELVRARSQQIRRRVLVLLSDGLDTASRLSADEMLALARRAGIGIYVIAMPTSSSNLPRHRQDASAWQGEHVMRTLARESGGRSFFPKRVEELPAIYADIAQELANQYELGYLPSRSGTQGGFRRVTVHVENAMTRTRSGYYAGQEFAAATLPDVSAPLSLGRPH